MENLEVDRNINIKLLAWSDLHLGKITVEEFMERAARLKGDVTHLLNRESNGREGGEFEVHETPTAVILENDPDYDRGTLSDNPPRVLMDNAEGPQQLMPENREGANAAIEQLEQPIDDAPDMPYFYRARANVPHPQLLQPRPPRADIPDDEHVNHGTSSSSSDQSEDEFPIAIEPRLDPIDEVDIVDEDQGPPPNAIGPRLDPMDEVEIVDQDQGPPPNANDVLVPQQPRVELLMEPNINIQRVRRTGRQRRKKRKADEQIAAPDSGVGTEPTSQRNKIRNQRRKEMRKKARARQATQTRATRVENERLQLNAQMEEIRVQAQLAYVQEQVQRQAAIAEAAQAEAQRQRELLEAQENAASCRVCLMENATHTFLPCGHRCCCASCADRIWTAPDARCPLCRTIAMQAPARIWLTFE